MCDDDRDPLEFIPWRNSKFKDYKQVDETTKRALLYTWIEIGKKEGLLNDEVSSDEEWEEHEYENPPNDSFPKPYLNINENNGDADKSSGMDLSGAPQSENISNEQPNKGICRVDKFEVIKYTIGGTIWCILGFGIRRIDLCTVVCLIVFMYHCSEIEIALKQQQQVIPQTTAISNIKLPILKKEEYDIWAMEMENYLEYIDNDVWKVIQNGNSKKRISTGKDGIVRILSPVTAAEIQAVEKERKAKNIFLMAIPKEHMRIFHGMDNAKEIWEAIRTSSEGLEKGYDIFQQLLSQLEAHGAEVSTEDANHKFLRSLPPAWSNLAMTMRTKPEVDTLSIDDLYNNLRVFEQEIQGASKTSSSAQNVAFVSQSKSSTNKVKSGFTGAYSTCTPSTSSTNIPEKEFLLVLLMKLSNSLFVQNKQDWDWVLLHELFNKYLFRPTERIGTPGPTDGANVKAYLRGPLRLGKRASNVRIIWFSFGSFRSGSFGSSAEMIPQTTAISNIKLPILKKEEYDIWAMEMEHYLEYIDNDVWKVIQNGNSKKRISTGKDGIVRILSPVTAAEIQAVEKERKAKNILLMAIPKEHMRRFHGMDDAKEIWEAIRTRFGGNANSKKMQKAVFKQQFEAFKISSSEGLEKGYDRFQQLLSQLEAHGAEVSTEDANHKFLRSLPPDGASKTSSSAQNVAFVSQRKSNTNKVKSGFTGAYSICTPSTSSINIPEKEVLVGFADEVIYSLFAKQSEDWDLLHKDLEQIDDLDIEEMDINWQIAMIAIRMKKFYKKTGRRVRVDGKTSVGFDKKKLKCFNCHNTSHFARECTTKETNDGKKKRDSFYQHQEARKQEKNQMGLLTIDDGIVNWGEHTKVEEINHVLMAISSSNEVSLCSKTCIDSYNTLKTLCDEQMNQLGDQEAQILAYSQAVKKLEAQLVTFQKQQLSLNEKLTFQANEIYEKDEKLKRYRRIGMKAVKEKEQLQETLDSWKDSSKNLWRLINSGMSSNSKVGLGFEIQSNNKVLSYEDEMNFSVFNCSKEDSVGNLCVCSRFHVTPKTSHLNAVKRIFKYLKGKPNLGLWYPRESPFDLEAFSDSDYGGSNLDRKSTTGGCQFLRQRLISWQCKKQTIVATSTPEAEYVAAAN
ncbi:ribonuclease H-like domain-containing protein [Tanacetum coccineum]